MWGQLGDYFGTIQAGTTFRSFLAANSAQKYFLTALILSFCDIHDKSALVNILRQNMTIYLHGKWIDRKHILTSPMNLSEKSKFWSKTSNFNVSLIFPIPVGTIRCLNSVSRFRKVSKSTSFPVVWAMGAMVLASILSRQGIWAGICSSTRLTGTYREKK